MAHILPETLPQVMPPEVHRTFRSLKKLPDNFYVWHHLAPWDPDAPDFLLLTENGSPLLIKVSPASAQQAIPTAQMLLIQDDRTPLGQHEESVLDHFVDSLSFTPVPPVQSLVIFPNIPHRQVLLSRLSLQQSALQGMTNISWVGKELLQEDNSICWQDFLPDNPLPSLSLEKLRHAFTPEVVVPADMTVRTPVKHRIEAGLADYLLDYDQEAAVKADIDLTSDGKAIADDFRLNIINGVAGSGKTLILLYRLRLLYHLYPSKRFLVLTHNKPLIHDIQSRFSHLEGSLPDSIEWHTFNSWCYQNWPKNQPWIEPLKLFQRERLIKSIWQQHLGRSPITERMLLSEIDWIKDQLPTGRDEYRNVDRKGRGFRLTMEQRDQIYQAYDAYQNALQNRQACDWGDIPQHLWLFEKDGKITLPTYDVLLIDEAQFFAPLWIAILQKVLKPQNSHLFIVADPTQGFLGRGTSWKSLGLQARGRSQQLSRSYRTTREILQFATLFYRTRLSEEKDEDILAPDLFNMPNGSFPEMIALGSSQDEISRVANEVEAFVRKGCYRKNLLVLHTNGQGVRALIEAINHRLGRNAAIDPKDTYPGNYIRITTLNAGAGLESPIVFLVGLRDLFEEEQSLRLSDDEREMLIRDNTRKIYMAATRAGQRLVFTYVGELPDVLNKLLVNHTITM